MYLYYESFVDCLIKSGYKKIHSDLTNETWKKWDGVIVLTQDDYTWVVKINSYTYDDFESLGGRDVE